MATRIKFEQSTEERRRRYFSEEFKRKKVQEIDQRITTIAEVCRTYQVRPNSVEKWQIKYSPKRMKGVRVIVESESDTKRLIDQEKRIAELERALGQKQLMIDFMSKMIDLAEQEYQVDIKKKFDQTP
jgi:transposase-like protein